MARLLSALSSSVLLAAVATGCSAPRAYFRPAETTLTETVDGVAGAQYELRSRGDRKGEIRIWCLGAVQKEDAGDAVADPQNSRDRGNRARRTILELGIEIENNSNEELTFVVGDAGLRAVDTERESIDSVPPQGARSPVRVAVDSVSRQYLRFELPVGVRPFDVKSFRFRWVVTGPGTDRYTRFTTFVPDRRPYGGYYFWPYGPWGLHIGYWGLHCH